MGILQSAQFLAGLFFVVVLVAFLMYAFGKADELTAGQYQILRFLCSLCGGFAGALFTGEALFRLSAAIGTTGNIAVSGTAGAAVFFAVWFTFGKTVDLPDAVNIKIPPSCTFQKAVDIIAAIDHSVARCEGFTDAELKTVLPVVQIDRKTVQELLTALHNVVGAGVIRAYEVRREDPAYVLHVLA